MGRAFCKDRLLISRNSLYYHSNYLQYRGLMADFVTVLLDACSEFEKPWLCWVALLSVLSARFASIALTRLSMRIVSGSSKY